MFYPKCLTFSLSSEILTSDDDTFYASLEYKGVYVELSGKTNKSCSSATHTKLNFFRLVIKKLTFKILYQKQKCFVQSALFFR